eukprot:6466976-Amphidinium_carterae.1
MVRKTLTKIFILNFLKHPPANLQYSRGYSTNDSRCLNCNGNTETPLCKTFCIDPIPPNMERCMNYDVGWYSGEIETVPCKVGTPTQCIAIVESPT